MFEKKKSHLFRHLLTLSKLRKFVIEEMAADKPRSLLRFFQILWPSHNVITLKNKIGLYNPYNFRIE